MGSTTSTTACRWAKCRTRYTASQGSARIPSPYPKSDSGAANFTKARFLGPKSKVRSEWDFEVQFQTKVRLGFVASKSKSKSKVQFEMDFEVQVKKAKVRSELDFFELRSPSPSSSPRKRKMEQEAKEAGARSGLFLTGVILCVRPFQPRLTADCSN